MRRNLALGLALAVNGWLLAAPGSAQHPPRAAVSTGEPDMLRPYASRGTRPSDAARRGYVRPPVARGGPPPRPSVSSRGVGDYFPGMRPGQGPNRNVIDHRTLCVPGRRALLQR